MVECLEHAYEPSRYVSLDISDLFPTFLTVTDPFPTVFLTKSRKRGRKWVGNCHKYLFLDIAREHSQVASSSSSRVPHCCSFAFTCHDGERDQED